MELDKDFKEFIELLNKYEVDYLIVGGYALSFHGYIRNTYDIDIWLRKSVKTGEKMLRVLEEFFGETLELTVQDFSESNDFIQLGYPPYRIDLLKEISGVSFDDCYLKKLATQVSGIAVNYIDLESLKKNKLASGRAKDISDIDNLK